MSEHKFDDQLDDAVEALMNQRQLPAGLTPEVAEVVYLAEHLIQLPNPAFREGLKRILLMAPIASGEPQPRIITGADPREIQLAFDEMAARSPFTTYDLGAALNDLPELAMRFLAQMNECTLGVSRFSQHAHWERHPAGDEMLYVVDGAMDVTTLTADGPVVSHVSQGSLFVCPKGLWHRVDPRPHVSMLFATPGENTQHSDAATPEHPAGAPFAPASTLTPPHNVQAALGRVPELNISASTTETEAGEAFALLLGFNDCAVTVGRFRGLTPWERHPNDELLHVLDGEVDITVLTDDGPVQRHIQQGSIFVCPGGLWHRQLAHETVTGLYATPCPSEISWADDPRAGT
jgi:quercetin dioxygenase-like cupin family protein